MKNKRLIIILSIFVLLTTIIVLCSTVFTLGTITFSWHTTKMYLSEYADSEIAKDFPMGRSVFLLNKTEIKNTIEAKYPYLQIIKLETKFPNELVVHAAERVNMYAVTLEDNKYAVLDDENKVLDIITQTQYDEWDTSKSKKPIVVTVSNNGSNTPLKQSDFKVGYVANVKRVTSVLATASSTLEEIFWDEETNDKKVTNTMIKGWVKSVNIDIAYRSSLNLVVNDEGMKVKVQNCYNELRGKILIGKGAYDALKTQGKTTGAVVVQGVTLDDCYYLPFDY